MSLAERLSSKSHICSLLGQIFIFPTISQPRTLSADIPAAWRGLFTKYFRPKWWLLSLLSFQTFWQRAQFWKLGNYSMCPSWIWSDKITNERVARVGYNHFISNKGEWNNCFSKFSNRVLPPPSGKKIFRLGALFSIWRKTRTIGS